MGLGLDNNGNVKFWHCDTNYILNTLALLKGSKTDIVLVIPSLGSIRVKVDQDIVELVKRTRQCAHCNKRIENVYLAVNSNNQKGVILRFCTKNDITLTIDHIIPVSCEGPKNALLNMQLLCYSCNNKKGNNPPKLQVREDLIKAKQRELEYNAFISKNRYKRYESFLEDWGIEENE